MLKIQYVDKEIPLSTRDSGNQNFIKLRNSGYEELSKTMVFDDDAPQAKVGIFDRCIATIAGSMVSWLYILAGAGLLQGLLIIIRLIIEHVMHMDPEVVFNATGFGSLYNIISWTPFAFMPIFIAVAASKHFKCNPFIAVWCCAALINPDFTKLVSPDTSMYDNLSSSEAKQAQPQCLCGVAPFFLYGVMCATLHLDCIFLETIFELLICEMDWIY